MKGSLDFRCGYAKEAFGGAYGPLVYAHDVATLRTYLSSPDQLKIKLNPRTNYDLGGSKLYVGSNKTLIGDVGTSLIKGELRIEDVTNVVVYHVRFRDPVGDCITVKNSDLVHIHQCTMDQGTAGTNKAGGTADGAVDVVGCKRDKMRVTIAKCKVLRFHKVHLFGWDQAGDERIRVTCYRNWYRGNRRMPQCNRAYVHMRNNVHDWNHQCCASYAKARVWVDTCYITSKEKRLYCGEYKSSGKYNGYIGFSGCLYKDCRHRDYKKDKAKAAKAHWDTMPRLSKSWSSAKKVKSWSGMQYK